MSSRTQDPPSAQLRPAEPHDVEAMLRLREMVASEGVWIGAETPLDVDGDRARHLAAIEAAADGRSAFVLLADDGSDLLAGSLSLINPIGIAHLGMCLAPAHRGVGLGGAMLDRALEWARGSGAHKVDLDHWPWNTRARALYERRGFVEEGYRRRHWRRKDGSLWDSVTMGLVLDHTSPGHDVRATEPPA